MEKEKRKHGKLFVAYIIFLFLWELPLIFSLTKYKDIELLSPALLLVVSLFGILYWKKWARYLYFVTSGYTMYAVIVALLSGASSDVISGLLTLLIFIVPYYDLIRNKKYYIG